MLKSFIICTAFSICLASHAQTPVLQPPCNIPTEAAVDPANPPVVVTTAPNVDMGVVISTAIAQAVANGSNKVVVNSGGSAPMTTSVVLNNLSNFTLQLNPGTTLWGWNLSQPMFTVIGGQNVKIMGGTLFAGGTGTNGPSCISVLGTDAVPANTVELSGFECSGTTSHGVSVTGSGSTATSYMNVKNVSIHNTLIHDTGSLNIYASGVSNICMQSNTLVNPAVGGIAGNGVPVNAGVSYSENVYFGTNYVAGTPIFFRQPTATNTPPSGFYAFTSTNVNTDTNTFVDSQCTLALCSGTGDLPNTPSAIHDDTVLNAINSNNTVSSYGPGITCEVSWSCNVVGGYIHDVYAYALYDQSRSDEVVVNSLTSTAGLVVDRASSLKAVSDVVNGISTTVVQAAVPGTGIIFSQTFGSLMNDGMEPFPEIWVKSAQGQPADGYELWLSADTNIWDVHSKLALPALQAGQWTRVALPPPHISLMGILGVRTWAVVNPGNSSRDTLSVSDYRQVADSRNNTYSGVTIARTGAYPLDVSGCGAKTLFTNNTITDPGVMGIWQYTNSGLMGQVFVGGYPNCTRSDVQFISNVANLNSPAIPIGGSSLLNLTNYGTNNSITGVLLYNDSTTGPYASIPGKFVINNQGLNSTISTPSIVQQ